jgi:nickel-dependent lactate racemase
VPTIELPYGTRRLTVELPEGNTIGVLEERPMPVEDLDRLFERAWDKPIGVDDPAGVFRAGESVVFVVTDHTRPTPTRDLLPLVWNRIRPTVSARDVTVLVATGTHRPPSDEELQSMLGDARSLFRVEIHDSKAECVAVGKTSRGNPIRINRRVAEADHVVSIGHIGMHYYAGYSGGPKNILPGVAAAETIERNHALMVLPECAACTYEGNPISEEIVEASRAIRHRFIVDVVLHADGRVAGVFLGDPVAAHRAGRRFWDAHFQVPFDRRADLVIASCGGHPKDINLYQAHKGEYNAGLAVRDGGILYLAAACPMGIGHSVFAAWIARSATPSDVLRIYEKEGFRLGGHKAVYLARDRERVELALQSELDDATARRFFMRPMHDPAEALDLARARFGSGFTVLAMPHAASTFPVVRHS